VEGTVVRDRDRVRVTAQLIDGRMDRHVWAASYERPVRDVLSLQEEIARAVAGEVRVSIATRGAAARAVNPEAYEAYLRARYLWNKLGSENLTRALGELQTATRIDPTFALAHVGIADCYARLGWYGHIPAKESGERMKAATLAALALDDTLGEAHSSLGAMAGGGWNWPLAEKELRRALELNPSDSLARLRLGLVYEILGRKDENVSERREAVRLDPLNLLNNAALGEALFLSGDVGGAEKQVRRTLQLDAGFVQAHRVLGLIHESRRACPEAIAAYTKAEAKAELGHALAACGRSGEAETVLEELKAAGTAGGTLEVAMVQVGLGRHDDALTSLEAAFREQVPALAHTRVEPQFRPLWRHPRYAALLSAMRLPRAE
jgi:tetratricopeptide (TPR) repeat protein